MQLHLLMLMLAIVLHDQLDLAPTLLPWGLDAVVVGGALWAGLPTVALGMYAFLCRRALRQLAQGRGSRALVGAERWGRLLFAGSMAGYLAALYLGWLTELRQTLGDWVMVDELLMVLPMVLLMVGMWAVYYPIDRRIRQAALIGRIDAGLPIYPVWSLREYLTAQMRHQLLLTGAPLVLILAWQELLINVGPGGRAWMSESMQMTLGLVGSGSVFLLAPVMIRHLWDTIPLPQGELREMLIGMCKYYRIKVREILLWRTFGGLTNAAVMGVIGPVRYVLLSDALLDLLPLRQVEAVMAHELAHIRKHHILSLVLAALAGLEGLYLLADPLFVGLAGLVQSGETSTMNVVLEVLLHGMVVLCWVMIFGWVSRRFERQADTFAVQHLTKKPAQVEGSNEAQPSPPPPVLIDVESVLTMVLALQAVADTNHIPVRKRSWRHGSIHWRQSYLRSLVGQPLNGLRIDRQVRWIRIISVLVMIAAIAVELIVAS